MGILRVRDLPFNQPYPLAFAAPLDGEAAQSQYGPQRMFSTTAGALYLDIKYANQIIEAIQRQGIQPGQNSLLRKTKAGNELVFTVEPAQPVALGPVYAAPVSNGQTNGHNGASNGYSAPPAAPPPSPAEPLSGAVQAISARMMGCFMAAIDALVESQAYADRRGLKVTFTSEDVRSVAISCYIQCGKERA